MSTAMSTRPGWLAEQYGRHVLSVEEAGELLHIGRSSAYEAARRGEIPTIRIGRRLIVPALALERLLSGEEVQGEA